jgi:hypothetical protein
MLFALRAKMVHASGSSLSNAITRWFLAVQKAQRIPPQPLPAIGAEARDILPVIAL